MSKPVLYYVFDVLCGWCYGFSPVIKKLLEEYKNEFEFKVFSGGMVLGEREGPIGEVAPYIKDGFSKVEELSGVKFGPKFLEALDEGTNYFTSMPGALAIALFRAAKPELIIDYAAEVQKAIYYDGAAPADLDTYSKVAHKFGLEPKSFELNMQDQKVVTAVNEEFKLMQAWGINGYPSLVYMHNEQAHLLARGFRKFEDLVASLNQIKAESLN